MLGYDGAKVVCPATEGCLDWVRVYLGDCVCSARDAISLSLGLVSVVAWGVAEVPQIISNYREKSTEGVSLAFLLTWVVGDILNLTGCFLEEATLPTQLYTAALYTVTTLVLTYQVIYYDYISPYLHPEDAGDDEVQKPLGSDGETQPMSRPHMIGDRPTPSMPIGASPTATISVPQSHRAHGAERFYTSARLLASSHTPPMGSYTIGSRESGPQSQSLLRGSSLSGPIAEGSSDSPRSGAGSLAATIAGSVGSVVLVGTVGLSSNRLSARGSRVGSTSRVLHAGRRLLQRSRRDLQSSTNPGKSVFGEGSSAPEGDILGWIMAAIYMGGRIPQIWLNIKRGSVEGLSPFIFIFALVGNSTYVGSILVRNSDWGTIKHNMPWLVDAAVCVLLDFFIIMQFVYFSMTSKHAESLEDIEGDKKGDYHAISEDS